MESPGGEPGLQDCCRPQCGEGSLPHGLEYSRILRAAFIYHKIGTNIFNFRSQESLTLTGERVEFVCQVGAGYGDLSKRMDE